MSDNTCECRKTIEQKLTERFIQQHPDAKEHRMSLQGYGIAMVGNTLAEVPFMEFKATAQHRLKKGGFKEKTATGAMFFSFCPFCGRKLEAAGTDGSTPPTGD